MSKVPFLSKSAQQDLLYPFKHSWRELSLLCAALTGQWETFAHPLSPSDRAINEEQGMNKTAASIPAPTRAVSISGAEVTGLTVS